MPLTGLDKWAQENGTSTAEILMLLRAEKQDPVLILGKSIEGDTPVPSGRDTALRGMLERTRKGAVSVSIDVIADVMRCRPEDVTSIIGSAPDGRYGDALVTAKDESDGPSVFNSRVLPGLIMDIAAHKETDPDKRRAIEAMVEDYFGKNGTPTGQDGTPEQGDDGTGSGPDDSGSAVQSGAAEGAPRPPAAAARTGKAASRPAPRKKTKYAAGKAVIQEMLRPSDAAMPIREIRAFLLALPEYKPQDVALMSDDDVMSVFKADYVAIPVAGGALIMPPLCYNQLIDVIGTMDTYFVPDPTRQASEG